jgi:hypothetical protein
MRAALGAELERDRFLEIRRRITSTPRNLRDGEKRTAIGPTAACRSACDKRATTITSGKGTIIAAAPQNSSLLKSSRAPKASHCQIVGEVAMLALIEAARGVGNYGYR